jgi:HPt (histidine-containing phosphotransfer) domain-containing protein
MAEDRERCLRAGMDGYLVKPIQPAALLAAVEKVGREARRAAEPAEARPAGSFPAALLEQLGGDTRFLGEIADLFATESARHLAALREAIRDADTAAFRREVHTLRGMLRGLRAQAADGHAAKLQSLDPRIDKEQAGRDCDVLERAVSAFKERLVKMISEAQAGESAAEPRAQVVVGGIPIGRGS